jgi:hypothetical protein
VREREPIERVRARLEALVMAIAYWQILLQKSPKREASCALAPRLEP